MRSKWADVATRPVLLWEAALTAWAFRPRKGILPSRALIRWRIATAYGDASTSPAPGDVEAFLRWRRALRHDLRRAA